jgi:hypothetical protein
MKSGTRGLVVPSRHYLATDDHADRPVHPRYDHAVDGVAQFLESRGLATRKTFRGDLPFSFGLAGSTLLAFLHIAGTLSPSESLAVVHDCDRAMHRFEPSGVDAAAISRQTAGLYSSAQGWEDVRFAVPRHTLLFPRAEGRRSLPEIEERMGEAGAALARNAGMLTEHVVLTGELHHEWMLDYCRRLAEAGVYSAESAAVIAALLARGVAAKCIGGLYDKAILVLWPDAETEARESVRTPMTSFDASGYSR